MGKRVPPPPGPGRPKGSKNRRPPWHEDFWAVYEEKGGRKWLSEWVEASPKNKAMFMQTILTMAAKQVADAVDNTGTVVYRIIYEAPPEEQK